MQMPQTAKIKMQDTKKGFHFLTSFLYLAIFILLLASAYIALQINNNVSLQKPKATGEKKYTCQWCTNEGQCRASGITPWTARNDNVATACSGLDGCCGALTEVQPTSTGECTINYTAKCISLSGNCSGKTIRTFTGDYAKGCPNQGGSDVPASSGSQYCANADYGKCVQVDLLGGGGVCDCKAGSASPTVTNTPAASPTPSNTPTPTVTLVVSATPTLTPAISPTPSPTPVFSPTPTVTPVPNQPTATPVPNNCGTKGCDSSSNPCKNNLVCIQANDGSKYCSMPEFQTACALNPNQSSCCTSPTQPLLAKAVATRVPTIPVTGGIPLPVIIIPPVVLLLLGLLL